MIVVRVYPSSHLIILYLESLISMRGVVCTMKLFLNRHHDTMIMLMKLLIVCERVTCKFLIFFFLRARRGSYKVKKYIKNFNPTNWERMQKRILSYILCLEFKISNDVTFFIPSSPCHATYLNIVFYFNFFIEFVQAY